MKTSLLGGAALLALIPWPAAAQGVPSAVLQRLDALEARVQALEAQNSDLKQQLASRPAAPTTTPAVSPDAIALQSGAPIPPLVVPVPVRGAASGSASTINVPTARSQEVSWTIVPQFNSPDGNFTFKPRGMLEVDYANFHSRQGGYDYNNGTQIRRGRFGFDGTAWKQFAWRVEAEYVDARVNLLDAYVAYTGVKNFTVTLGQLKVPAGLEANTSDAFNEFLERGMANTAFGAVGGERRVGVTFAYANPLLTLTAGLYGAGEAVDRNATTPGEVWGYNGRLTIEPINTPKRLLHFGASAYRVQHLAGNSVTLSDRPNDRVDGGNLESVTIPGTNPANGPHTGVKDAEFYGLEGAGVWGPLSVQGEYSHTHFNRFDGASALNFDGYYGFASLFLTGESRAFKNGLIDRLRPKHNFDPANGHWGAVELAARYDRINLTDRALSPLDHDGHAWTAAVNWYLTGYVKLMVNYIRFTGQNSPLVNTPVSIYGTTAKGDAFATRLHIDF